MCKITYIISVYILYRYIQLHVCIEQFYMYTYNSIKHVFKTVICIYVIVCIYIYKSVCVTYVCISQDISINVKRFLRINNSVYI